MKRLGYGVASWLVVISVWSAVTYSGAISALFLPKPHEVFQELALILLNIERTGWYVSPNFWVNLLITGRRVLVSMLLASLLAIPAGVIMARSPKAKFVMAPIIEFFRALPVTILYPVFGFVFGYFDDNFRIAMATFGSGLVITVGVYEGGKQLRPRNH